MLLCSFSLFLSPVPASLPSPPTLSMCRSRALLERRPSLCSSGARHCARAAPVSVLERRPSLCSNGARHCARAAPVTDPVACRWRRERPMGPLCQGSERRLPLTPPYIEIDPGCDPPSGPEDHHRDADTGGRMLDDVGHWLGRDFDVIDPGDLSSSC